MDEVERDNDEDEEAEDADTGYEHHYHHYHHHDHHYLTQMVDTVTRPEVAVNPSANWWAE